MVGPSKEAGVQTQPSGSNPGVSEYFNDFNDLDGWILGEGLFSLRCGKPVGQSDSKIFLPSNVAAGYLELPNPIAIQEGDDLIIEVRYRYNDLGGMYIGFSPTNDYICNAEWYIDGVFLGLMGGERTNPSGVGLFLSQNHQRYDGVRVDRAMDDDWHIARIIRKSSTQEWFLYIDDEFLGSAPIVDNISSYKYLSFNAYGEGNLPAEIDYIKVYQE